MLPVAIQSFCETTPVDLTAIRATLLAHLWQSRKPAKAYDMIEVLREKGIGAPKPATVYRTLEYLAGFGLVHKVYSLNAYVPCHHPGRHQGCQFLICDHCESAQEFCDADLRRSIPDKARALGFEPRSSIVEVYGTCSACQKA